MATGCQGRSLIGCFRLHQPIRMLLHRSPPKPHHRPQQLSVGDRFQAATAKAKRHRGIIGEQGQGRCPTHRQTSRANQDHQHHSSPAYQALGKHVHDEGAFRDDLGDIYQKIDGLLKDIEAHSTSDTKAEGFAEKAKAVAKASRIWRRSNP